MVAAAADVLVRAAVERDGLAIVEHLVAGLDEQEVTFGPRDAGDRHRAELVHVLARDLEGFARVEVGLDAERGFERLVRPDRGIDHGRAGAEALGETSGVKAAERAADERDAVARVSLHPLDHAAHRHRRPVVQLRNVQHGRRWQRIDVRAKPRRLDARRRAPEAMQVDKGPHARRGRGFAAPTRGRHVRVLGRPCGASGAPTLASLAAPRGGAVRVLGRPCGAHDGGHESAASSFSWMPPKPPLLITSTWSPGFASRAIACTSAGRSESTVAAAPSGASAPATSQPRFAS